MNISVVIPTYNRRHLLGKCLAGLEKQTASLDSFEVIVVVDGSEDGTLDFLINYSPAYPFKYIFIENSGLSAARNNGARLASSQYLIFLDDDIVADPRLVEEHLSSLRQAGDALIQGGLSIHPQVIKTPFIRVEEARLQAFMDGKGFHESLIGEEISGGNLSISRNLFLEIGEFNSGLRWNEDGEFGHRLEQRGIPIFYNKNALGLMADIRDLERSLKASYDYGRSYVLIERQHPEIIWKFSPLINDRDSPLLNFFRRFLYFRQHTWQLGGFEELLRVAIQFAEKIATAPFAGILYRVALDYFFWKGVFAESSGDMEKFKPLNSHWIGKMEDLNY